MKNIAIVIGDISKSAGTERAVTNLSNILQNSGNYKVVIISQYSKNGQKCYYYLNPYVKIEYLQMTNDGWLSRLKTSKIFLNKIIEICFRYKVDVIIGTTHGYNIQLAKIKTGVKKVGCEHLNYKAAPWYSRILRRLAYSKLDAVVCLTKKDSEKYSFVNKNKGKKFVISKSLNIFRFIKNWNIYYLYPIKKIINTHRKNAKKITNGSNVTNYVAIVREPPQRIYGFPKTCCTEFIYHTFENCEFRIPKNYDALLQSFYGDYMKLPPKEAQVNAHGLTAYFVEK